MTSSLRTATLSDTLAHARTMATELGITRVTDTTWLDRIGIPVFASIRPGAMTGSLCVNAGKGVHPDEARVGAYMEAIEFALAEYGASALKVIMSTPREFAAQSGISFNFVDLCPQLGRKVTPDGPLACVEAIDVSTGQALLVPAELVFSPYPKNPGQRIFGTSTNGLASGNTVEEATVHGVAELMERDVQAHNFFRDQSLYVDFDVPAPDIDQLRDRIGKAGLEAVVRYTPSEFGLPYFEAFILEPASDSPIAIAQGSGLHVVKSISAVRALAEAAQSRLSHIHGGRDDLMERHQFFATQGGDVEQRAETEVRARVHDRSRCIKYSEIQDASHSTRSIGDAMESLAVSLRQAGVQQILRVVLSGEDSPLAVVKVIAPKLESFQPSLKRVGPRLVAFTNAEKESN
ncbi:YcaO-like family protein [Streptomyces sp. NPDC012600]|uniref:YcaO-like family protein n=1 Tax=Streptomyces sp. NPDC012600 TaxID=3415005 RepID=UPI003C30CB73